MACDGGCVVAFDQCMTHLGAAVGQFQQGVIAILMRITKICQAVFADALAQTSRHQLIDQTRLAPQVQTDVGQCNVCCVALAIDIALSLVLSLQFLNFLLQFSNLDL